MKIQRFAFGIAVINLVLLVSDHATDGVELHANRDKGNFLKVVSSDGREQVIKP